MGNTNDQDQHIMNNKIINYFNNLSFLMNNSPLIIEENVRISSNDKAYLYKKLNRLQDISPSDALIKLTIKQSKLNYKLVLVVKNFNLHLFSIDIGHNILETYLVIEKAILKQLHEWKQKRFKAKQRDLTASEKLLDGQSL